MEKHIIILTFLFLLISHWIYFSHSRNLQNDIFRKLLFIILLFTDFFKERVARIIEYSFFLSLILLYPSVVEYVEQLGQ